MKTLERKCVEAHRASDGEYNAVLGVFRDSLGRLLMHLKTNAPSPFP